jgi:hypothetical protein
MPRSLRVPALVACVLTLPAPAAAWHRDGHLAIARFAWNELADKERTAVAQILRGHPHYKLYLAAERPEGVDEGEWAFVRAATWPDWVRDPVADDLRPSDRAAMRRQFNKPAWHFVNLPYIHPEETDRFDAAAIRQEVLRPAFDPRTGAPRHALAALERAVRQLQAAGSSPEERAIALCWLLHLVGDLHQPLHASALIASKATVGPESFHPPQGDRGGNRLAVRRKAGDRDAVVLHFYWDALLFEEEPDFKQVDAVVAGWRKGRQFQREQLPELAATGFLAWADESLRLAKEVVYQGKDGLLKAAPLALHTRATRGLVSGLQAPVLPDGYEQKARAVAARQMVLAGFRLADQLKRALAASGATGR